MGSFVILSVVSGSAVVRMVGFLPTIKRPDEFVERDMSILNDCMFIPLREPKRSTGESNIPAGYLQTAAILRKVFGRRRVWFRTSIGEELCIEPSGAISTARRPEASIY